LSFFVLEEFVFHPTTQNKQTCCFLNKIWSETASKVCLKQFCKNFFSGLHQDKFVKKRQYKSSWQAKAKKKATKTKGPKGTVVVWFEFSTSQPAISLTVECILKNWPLFSRKCFNKPQKSICLHSFTKKKKLTRAAWGVYCNTFSTQQCRDRKKLCYLETQGMLEQKMFFGRFYPPSNFLNYH